MLVRRQLISTSLLGVAAILTITHVSAVHLPTCYFLMRDWNGVYVEVMRKCPIGTSFCAARVSNATGIRSMIVDLYEYYCENERNFVCFCEEDFCNSHDKIERLFLSIHGGDRPTKSAHPPTQPHSQATLLPTQNTEVTTLSFSEEFRKLRSPFLIDRQELIRSRTSRQAVTSPPPRRSFEQKVASQKFILAEEGTIFRKNVGRHHG